MTGLARDSSASDNSGMVDAEGSITERNPRERSPHPSDGGLTEKEIVRIRATIQDHQEEASEELSDIQRQI